MLFKRENGYVFFFTGREWIGVSKTTTRWPTSGYQARYQACWRIARKIVDGEMPFPDKGEHEIDVTLEED